MGFRTVWHHWLWLQVFGSRETTKVGSLSNKDIGLLGYSLSLIYKKTAAAFLHLFISVCPSSVPLTPPMFSLLSVSLPLALSFTTHSVPWVRLTPSLESLAFFLSIAPLCTLFSISFPFKFSSGLPLFQLYCPLCFTPSLSSPPPPPPPHFCTIK